MDIETLQLGEHRDVIDADRREQHQLAAVAMVSQAHLSIDIASRQLDPSLYDRQLFSDALRAAVVAHPKLRVRLLVHDARAISSRGHQLVNLAQRLSSFVEMRVPDAEFRDYNHGLLLADEQGYLFQEKADRYEGVICFNDPSQAHYYTRQFNRMWDTAKPDLNLRRMTL